MTIDELHHICLSNGRRPLRIQTGRSAVIAVCGMEGRLFYAHNGRVVSLFRPAAAEKISSSRNGYFNPGGDGLWPAPEGTRLGYEYAVGAWRVPAALTGAQYEVLRQTGDSFVISAEIDLVNNRQLGIPCRFTREARVLEESDGTTVVEQHDSIEYIGSRPLAKGEFLLAPWSLSQFAVDHASLARFGRPDGAVRDLYSPSAELLSAEGDVMTMRHSAEKRVQLALPEQSAFVELRLPDRRLTVRRTSQKLAPELHGVDIADAAPDRDPEEAVRFSIYNDPSGFMELEVVGGCTAELLPGTILGVHITNTIQTMED